MVPLFLIEQRSDRVGAAVKLYKSDKKFTNGEVVSSNCSCRPEAFWDLAETGPRLNKSFMTLCSCSCFLWLPQVSTVELFFNAMVTFRIKLDQILVSLFHNFVCASKIAIKIFHQFSHIVFILALSSCGQKNSL